MACVTMPPLECPHWNAPIGQIWSMKNADSNPNLVLITPGTLAKSAVYAMAPVNNGGSEAGDVWDRPAWVGRHPPPQGLIHLRPPTPRNKFQLVHMTNWNFLVRLRR